MGHNHLRGVDSYAAFFVRQKAKSLIHSGLFNSFEQEDLEQELMLGYLEDCHNFDPTKANHKIFTRMVINHRAGQLIRKVTTDKRKVHLRQISLDQPLSSEDEDLALVDLLADSGEIADGTEFQDIATQSILKIDLERMRATLPEELQVIFDLLGDYTVSEIAQRLDIPRTTITSRIKKIRDILLRASFEKNL